MVEHGHTDLNLHARYRRRARTAGPIIGASSALLIRPIRWVTRRARPWRGANGGGTPSPQSGRPVGGRTLDSRSTGAHLSRARYPSNTLRIPMLCSHHSVTALVRNRMTNHCVLEPEKCTLSCLFHLIPTFGTGRPRATKKLTKPMLFQQFRSRDHQNAYKTDDQNKTSSQE